MKARYGLLLPLALLVLGLLVWLPFRGDVPKRQHVARATATQAAGDPAPVRERRIPANVAARSVPSPEGYAVIEGVKVDRSEICRGEQVIVTVNGRSKDDGKGYLSYEVVDRPDLVGPRFALRLDESLGVGEMQVLAYGKYGAIDTFDIPPVFVKDCEAPATLDIAVSRPSQSMDRALLSAELRTVSDTTFEPVKYDWDLGDGTKVTTTEPTLVHSYEGRTQETAYSYYFVKVTATDSSGATVSGSHTLRFVNLGFIPLTRQERVVIFSGVEQRESGERIWLYHGAPFDVDLDEVVVKDVTVGADGRQTTTSRSYEPGALLGVTTLPKGRSVELHDLSRLQPEDPQTTRIVEVKGRRGGKTAEGAFTLVASREESSDLETGI